MRSSTSGRDDDAPELVDALSFVRWKRHQDAAMELSAHGIVLTVEESGCLQAKVFLKRELFVEYDYAGEGRERFGLSLGLYVDCLNIFSAPGHASAVEIRYPGPDMKLLLNSSNQWTPQMHVCMQKSERELRIQSPGITNLSMTGILQSLSL